MENFQLSGCVDVCGEGGLLRVGMEALCSFPRRKENFPPQNVFHWHENYFEMEAIKILQTQEKLLSFS